MLSVVSALHVAECITVIYMRKTGKMIGRNVWTIKPVQKDSGEVFSPTFQFIPDKLTNKNL